MEEIITATYNKLKDAEVRVVDQRPPVGTAYPFIHYTINEPSVNVNPSLFTLIVDIWTESKSYLQVEQLATVVNKEFADDVVLSKSLMAKIKKTSELRISDENVDIKRKRIVYQMRVFNY